MLSKRYDDDDELYDTWIVGDLEEFEDACNRCKKGHKRQDCDKKEHMIKLFLIKLIKVLKRIEDEVDNIEDKLDSPTFGLEEIKTEVANIEDLLEDPSFGLEEIKNEIIDIITILESETFGLEEIKSEVASILFWVSPDGACPRLTTGPLRAQPEGNWLVVRIENLSGAARSINFEVYDTTAGPVTLLDDVTQNVPNNQTFDYSLNIANTPDFEVRLDNIEGVKYTVFTSNQENGRPIAGDPFLVHSELSCLQ